MSVGPSAPPRRPAPAEPAPSLALLHKPEHLADPYPLFRRVREAGPIRWDGAVSRRGAWVVTGYDEALKVVRDPRLSVARPHWDPAGAAAETDPRRIATLHAMHGQMFAVDPPRHTRVRRPCAHAFLPQAVERMRPKLEATADRLLDAALRADGPVDVMAAYGFALPAVLMSELLGIPLADRSKYFRWMLGWGLLVDEGPSAVRHAQRHLDQVAEYVDYFRDLVTRRRAEPGQDLLQQLVDTHDAGGYDSTEELLGNLIFLFNAGQMTTAHQIGNSLLHLLRDRSAYQRLRDEPDLVAAVNPELLRYDCSVQVTRRWVVEPVGYGGHEFAVGDEVLVWLGAANHDPARFPDPDRLDLDRRDVRHLAFSHGSHYCLGGGLAEAANEIAVRAFTRRVADPRPVLGELRRSITPTFRGPHQLPVTLR